MNFEINAEIYMRLARLPASIPQRVLNLPEEDAESLKCVRLEYRKGGSFAIATNRKIAAVYYLGTTDQPDAVAHLTIDPALVKQCETEKQFASKLFVVSIPELQTTTIKSSFGYVYPGNAGVYVPRTRLDEWATWVPKTIPATSIGAMTWNTADIEALSAASPSGRVVFPEFIDAMQPVIIRDNVDPNWVGMFMSNVVVEETGEVITNESATIPDWWQK